MHVEYLQIVLAGCKVRRIHPSMMSGLHKLRRLQAVLARVSHWDAIYSSDLARAAQTAQAIVACNWESNEEVKEPQTINYRAAFRERKLGVLEVIDALWDN